MNLEDDNLFTLNLLTFALRVNEWVVLKSLPKHWTLICQVLDILYQTEDGFAVPDEEDCPPPPEDEEY